MLAVGADDVLNGAGGFFNWELLEDIFLNRLLDNIKAKTARQEAPLAVSPAAPPMDSGKLQSPALVIPIRDPQAAAAALAAIPKDRLSQMEPPQMAPPAVPPSTIPPPVVPPSTVLPVAPLAVPASVPPAVPLQAEKPVDLSQKLFDLKQQMITEIRSR